MKTRTYKSGTRWCFWRWGEAQDEYIIRLHFLKTPWWQICVHWMYAPDPEPFDHDHSNDILSFTVRGGYQERRNGKLIWRRWLNYIRGGTDKDHHTIVAVLPNTVTLTFWGPKQREWGFHTPAGRVVWKDYYKQKSGRTFTT